jgi:hypothetical protein
MGEKGVPGKDGQNGRDGSLEQLRASYDGERTLTLTFKDGRPIEGGVIVLPIPIDRGVWSERAYDLGDVVTWDGAAWIAKEPTTDKPAYAKGAWRLAVKQGRPGKQGQPGENGKDGRDGRDLTQMTLDGKKY